MAIAINDKTELCWQRFTNKYTNDEQRWTTMSETDPKNIRIYV